MTPFCTASVFALLPFVCVLSSQTSYAQGTDCSATADQSVNICSPSIGSVVSSPVQFTAAALDQEHPVTGMVVYVDSQQRASSGGATLSASVPLSSGNHTVLVRAWDSTGFFFSSQGTITVANPSVAISA